MINHQHINKYSPPSTESDTSTYTYEHTYEPIMSRAFNNQGCDYNSDIPGYQHKEPSLLVCEHLSRMSSKTFFKILLKLRRYNFEIGHS